jgi:23S rRNA (uracil-5-)-methyltransferase RumA
MTSSKPSAPIELTPQELKSEYLAKEINPFIPEGTKLVEPPCPAFKTCGGCQLQHIPVYIQPEVKRQKLISAFSNANVNLKIPVENTRANIEHAFGYRNKADLTSKTWDNRIHLGFNSYGGKGELIEVDECPILMPVINKTLNNVRGAVINVEELARKLVSITIRASKSRNESFLLYHSKYKDEKIYSKITGEVQKTTEELTGGTFIKKGKEFTKGSSIITERVGSIDLYYTVRTFFQANIFMLDELCKCVGELIEPTKKKKVLLDIYCGVGLFALQFAKEFSEVYGIESTPASIDMAIKNAKKNNLSSIPFYRDCAEDRLEQLLRTGIFPDVIILDPPRSGLHKNVIASLIGLLPSPDLILVSCNPVSLADNVKDLEAGGYVLERLIPVDMFPQTEHLEVVARMTRKRI